jgi:hypothetical protein
MDPEMQQVIHESTTINGREKTSESHKGRTFKDRLRIKMFLNNIIHFSSVLDCKISSTGIILLIA